MRVQQYLLVFAAAFALAGCDTDISGSFGEDPSPGSADFSTFVAVGDSLTAGYADGALYRHGQENSFPAILAQQFALVGGGTFTQPLMPIGGTGSLSLTGIGDIGFGIDNLGLSDRQVVVPTGDPESPVAPGTIMPVQITSIDVRVGAGGFNNMGVPGAKSFHLSIPPAIADVYGELSPGAITGGSASPYFARFSSSDTASMISDAVAQGPSFFVLWIGNNDVLSYATDGGATGLDRTGNADPTTYGPTDITDPGFFATTYPALVTDLTAGGAKGILINIPDVSSIPYFTTIPFNAIPLDAMQATDANAGFALYNIGVQSRVGLAPGPPTCGITQAESDRRQISFAEGQNRVVILDKNLTDLTPCLGPAAAQIRQAAADDFIVLPTLAKLGEEDMSVPAKIWGISRPLEDADVLIDTEFAAVNTARLAYNATIKAAADADPDLLLFDAAAKLVELNTTGILYGSGGISSAYIQGGGFSLDGIHLTARGYSVIANEIFKIINEGFGAYIPPVDPDQYTTVFYQ